MPDFVMQALGIIAVFVVGIGLFILVDFALFYMTCKAINASEDEAEAMAKGWHFKRDEKTPKDNSRP